MSVCVSVYPFDLSTVYPVLDPRRTPGPGPWSYGYLFAWDAMVITVERTPGLSACRMRVKFSTTLTEGKEIQGWNLFANTAVDRIGSPSLGLPTTMELRKAGSAALPCTAGADTLVFCRYFAWPRGRTALYTFPAEDFWDFWGGCTVTFDWFNDTAAGRWGHQTPAPVYPIVPFPDGTLMRDGAGFRVVFGGTDFAADDALVIDGIRYLDRFDPITAVPFRPLKALPVDGTLLREWNRPEVYVVYGGVRFHIPDEATLFGLGFEWRNVGVIPPGGTGKLRAVPLDGTLLKERTDPKVYLVDQGQLHWVTSPAAMQARCLPWRHVRTVPDGALVALPRGADFS